MKKYIHIMHNEKFIESYIEFIKNNFNLKKHKFYLIDGKEFKVPSYQNVFIYKSDKNINIFIRMIKLWKFLYKVLKEEGTVYFHSLFDKRIILFLFIFRKFLKKSNWIIWGADLYCYENRNKSLKNFLWYKIEDYVKRNFAYINTLVPGDYKIAKKYYNVKGEYKRAFYPIKIDFNFLDSLFPIDKKEIYVQIGNSADLSNNHFEIIDTLSKYKDENIKIFCILSYGDKNYGKKVNEYGKKVFGDKFVGIFDFMDLETYYKYLINIDILVFNQKRQQGLANLEILSYFEKKIYLREDISSWDYLTKDIGLKINSYKNIKEESFDEFILNDSVGNKIKIKNTVYSNLYRVKIWKDNFEGR